MGEHPKSRAPLDLDALILREYGSYLHNVIPNQLGLCPTCATPIADGYTFCVRCHQTESAARQGGHHGLLADRIAFMTYAVERGQGYSVLRGYKEPQLRQRYWSTAATWLIWFLDRHASCAHRLAGPTRQDWLWATIPSVRSSRPGEHPLHKLVKHVWGHDFAEVDISPAGSASTGRAYDPTRFVVNELPPGKHVFLIDDSWATGANAQSAATALKMAGADQVSVMVLGRLLRDDWAPTREALAAGLLRTPFDPRACPWPGAVAHS